jgi:hypothetical protein
MIRLYPIISILSLLGFPLAAQTELSIPRDGADRLLVKSHFGGVEVSIYEGETIEVVHLVLINDEEHPELSELEYRNENGTIILEEVGPTADDWSDLQDRNKDCDCNMNSRIKLRVRVPRDLDVSLETLYGSATVTDVPRLQEIESTYGGIEVRYTDTGLAGPLKLYSNYGAVDLTLPPDTRADLELETQFGELLTDFDVRIDEAESEQRQFHERVVGSIGGGGAQVQCKSPYGKVYLRQSE